MSFQYFIKSDNPDWIPQANRQVKVFPSGLVMIQQDFIYPANVSENTAFNVGDSLDDGTPCMDQAYVFPDPSLQQMGNGFTKTTVTAYGRINSTGRTEFGWLRSTGYVRNQNNAPVGYFDCYNQTARLSVVNDVPTFPATPTLDSINNGTWTIFYDDGTHTYTPPVFSVSTDLVRTDSTNYGNWNEIVFSFQATGFATTIETPIPQ